MRPREQEDKTDSELIEVAREEQDFVRNQLAQALGREPTSEEIDEWLRDHTESY